MSANISGSRTPSPHGKRRDSRRSSRRRRDSLSDGTYSDTYSRYSDSFTDDESVRRVPRQNTKGPNPERASNNRGGRGRGKNTTGRTSKAKSSPRGVAETLHKRMLSARRLKINELRSETESLQQEVEMLRKENRVLSKQQRLADRQLQRYEGDEADIPALLQRHAEEIRSQKEMNKRVRDKYHKCEQKLKETDSELRKTQKLVRKMKGLVDDKQLKERDELSQKLSKMEADLDDKTRKIEQLERHRELSEKNHRHEFGIERARHKETTARLKEIESENQNLKMTLREKEKELEIKNIYSNRVMRAPHKLNSSVSSSPLPERPPRPHRRKNSTPSTMTPREKAKQMEEHRRDEMRRQREKTKPQVQPQHQKSQQSDGIFMTQLEKTDSTMDKSLEEKSSMSKPQKSRHQKTKKTDTILEADTDEPLKNSTNRSLVFKSGNRNETQKVANSPVLFKYTPTWTKGENEHQKPEESRKIQKVKEEEKSIRLKAKENDFDNMLKKTQRLKLEDSLDEEKTNGQEKNNEEQIEEERREKQRLERLKQKEEDDRLDRLEKERRERESKEAQARERKQHEERERKEREDRERREIEELERKEQEKARKEQEEFERRAELEQTRLANDAAERERRRQKDILLAKMRMIDESKLQENTDPFMVPESRKPEPTESRRGSKKDYDFTEPIVNMHNGKPAYKVKVPVVERGRKKGGFFDDDDNDELGGYQPSFTGKGKSRGFLDSDSDSGSAKMKKTSQKSQAPERKSNLIDNLFGNSTSTSHSRPAQKENSSTALFGGGNAIIDDDSINTDNSKLLPRRTRQPTSTISSKPTVNAIDHFDDDIEEVIL